jgi:predicted GNAT family N-acyltransferase
MARPVDLTTDDASELTGLYADHHWWDDRAEGRVATAITNADLALGLRDDGELVASARVLTDAAYYATAYDVIVAADRRGVGLGRELMDAVVTHDALGDAPRVSLACRGGLTDFYADCGFELAQETVEHDGEREPLAHMTYHR